MSSSTEDLLPANGAIPPAEARIGSKTDEFFAEIDTNEPPRPLGEGSVVVEDEPGPRPSWPMVLLGSYASAVTLALAWVLLTQRAREPAVTPSAPAPAEARAEPEDKPEEARGRKIGAVAAIPSDRVAHLGETLRVGSLEVTPVDVRRQAVTLRRRDVSGRPVVRKGMPGTIVLHVRLHNATKDLSFAPVDPSFVRQHGQDVPDCFAETSGGDRIYPYPLALESELAIVGQEFDELRPGESRVVAFVTAPDAPAVAPESLAWRLRLRTGIETTEAIAVRPPGAKPM